ATTPRREVGAPPRVGKVSVLSPADRFKWPLPAVSKHLKVLERAGLITRGRDAQMRPCRIDARALKEADDWLEEYRRLWEQRLDRLDDYLRTLQAKRKQNKRETRHGRRK